MDYGHTTQSISAPREIPFFTSGQGTNSEQVNNFEPENNLDITNDAWRSTQDYDAHNMGRSAITSTESSHSARHNADAPMGEVVTMSMPPSEGQGRTKNTISAPDFAYPAAEGPAMDNLSEIKTGDMLNAAGIHQMDALTADFMKTGDATSFYDAARELVEVNMGNSYGSNSAWKKEAA